MRRTSSVVRGGANRPSGVQTAVVISADHAVRADWARHLESRGMRVLRCVGPQVLCALLDGGHCPLHDEADLAVYDRATLTPELTRRLIRVRRSLTVAFARDRLGPDGRHEPIVTATVPDGAGSCFGYGLDDLVR